MVDVADPVFLRSGYMRAVLLGCGTSESAFGPLESWNQDSSFGCGSIPIHTIFRGMNIHLPAILMFTRGIGF